MYTTIDKSGWSRGPWDDEPDKVQFKDEATGLPCLVKRNPRLGIWCGYVGVPPRHPLFGLDPDDVDVDVHGGLTYADTCEEGDESTSICHVPEPGEPDEVWWLGFDCGHAWDVSPAMGPFLKTLYSNDWTYKTLSYVRGECARLAAQLEKIGKEGK